MEIQDFFPVMGKIKFGEKISYWWSEQPSFLAVSYQFDISKHHNFQTEFERRLLIEINIEYGVWKKAVLL